jgi:tRNA dimethylallyltransferase
MKPPLLVKPPLAVAIMGPTASGKTAAALAIARQIPCEIISVDSALVYRGMDVGTAKPSAAERAVALHHLIDIIDPLDAYSAMQFRTDARRLIAEIQGRGKLPLLVGGTMLYFKVLRDGLDVLPGADPEVRARLDAEATADGVPAQHARLAQLDPITAARLKPNDSQRIQRALEVIELSGQTMSSLLTGANGMNGAPAYTLLPLALEPSQRSALHERIVQRFDLMLADDALLTEVSALRARGDLHPGLPSIRCVGYRQAWEYLDGAIDRAAFREKSIIATRQLAKRQLTWLRAMDERIVIDCLAADATAQVLAKVHTALRDHLPAGN